jgi:chromosome segregation ATPase
MCAKRKGRPGSLSDSATSPEEKRSGREGCNSELMGEMNDDSYESTSAVDLLTKKMDTVLAKLQKLDSIENRLDNLFKAMSNIEETVASLDKEVHNFKEKVNNTNKTVKELEDSVDFNDEEIANLKRDLKASQKSIDDLSKQLLYQEHYSRRENLMFMGIAENNVTDGRGTQQEPENTKEIVYKFMEEEMHISNPRDSIEFQRIQRVGKPKDVGPRLIIEGFGGKRALEFFGNKRNLLCSILAKNC